MRRVVVSLVMAAQLGCSGDEDETAPPIPPPAACQPGEWQRGVGDCVPAGLPADAPCAPGEWLRDGACTPAGLTASDCAEGFTHDGDACIPVLPDAPCSPGSMSVPGDTSCHPIAVCGSGTWGDIAVETNTEFVDASYAGGGSDGTSLKPWTTIAEGITNAASGAIVAVAQGSYPEAIVIKDKPVRLIGRCPDLVEIAPLGGFAAVTIIDGAGGSEVATVALTGPAVGLAVSGSEDVVIDHVWVHDAADMGVAVEGDLGPTAITLRSSVVQGNINTGISVIGARATIEKSVVRETKLTLSGIYGRGIDVEADLSTGQPSTLVMSGSLIDDNRDSGVLLFGSDATIEGSVVRDTTPDASQVGGGGIVAQFDPGSMTPTATLTVRGSWVSGNHDTAVFLYGADATIEGSVLRETQGDLDGLFGHGILAQGVMTGEPATLSLRSSLVTLNHEVGVVVEGSDATLEGVVVRDQYANGNGEFGYGILVQPGAARGSTFALSGSIVEHNHETGVFLFGSPGTIDATVVRGTLPVLINKFGRGIAVQAGPTLVGSSLTLHGSVLEQNRDVQLFVSGSQATVEQSVIRDTVGDDRGEGWALAAQTEAPPGGPSNLELRASRIEKSFGVAVFVQSSEAHIDGCVVSGTQLDSAQTFGDAIAILSDDTEAHARIDFTRVEQSGRSAVALFGARVSYGNSAFACQSFDIIGEPRNQRSFAVENLGGNACGCPEPADHCLLQSAGFSNPVSVDPTLPPP